MIRFRNIIFIFYVIVFLFKNLMRDKYNNGFTFTDISADLALPVFTRYYPLVIPQRDPHLIELMSNYTDTIRIFTFKTAKISFACCNRLKVPVRLHIATSAVSLPQPDLKLYRSRCLFLHLYKKTIYRPASRKTIFHNTPSLQSTRYINYTPSPLFMSSQPFCLL